MSVRIIIGDVRDKLAELPDESVHCCVTSPPYFGLRDYQVAGQIGLEATPDAYVAEMVAVFREVRRVLRDDGTLWLNLGDSYASSTKGTGGDGSSSGLMRDGRREESRINTAKGSIAHQSFRPIKIDHGCKPKDLLGIPWRVAFALQADGWWLRSDIIWHKPNPMPESVQGSHFSRHMVTIDDYERLSGMRYVDERAGQDWAGDMPSLSEIEVPKSKAPLSAERQGKDDIESTGRQARCEGETSPVLGIGAGFGEPCKIRERREGKSQRQQARGEIPGNRQGAGKWPESGSKPPRSNPPSGGCGNGAGLDRDSGSTQTPLLLLSEAHIEDDARPRNPAGQGRPQLARERRARLPLVQQREEGSDLSDLLVGCPGCPKCAKHHGYIFHLSAGRPTSAHEHIFLLAKSERYYFDADAVKEPAEVRDYDESKIKRVRNVGGRTDGLTGTQGGYGLGHTGSRNIRNVWTIATQPYSEAHFATFPPALIEPCIKAGCPVGGTVLDPFGGAGTTGLVADRLGRNAILTELNPEYAEIARKRISGDAGMFAKVDAA